MAKRERQFSQLDVRRVYDYLDGLRPKRAKASPECRALFEAKVLPVLRDQMLSELRQMNGSPPRLIMYRDNGEVAPINLADQMPGFGDGFSKDKAARMHQLFALLPGVKASVLCFETWVLAVNSADGDREFKDGIADHPDRTEALMLNLLHYEADRNEIMQLTAMLPVVKVLGYSTTPAAWKHTSLGTPTISDPFDHDIMRGRFIFGEDE